MVGVWVLGCMLVQALNKSTDTLKAANAIFFTICLLDA
ncbi:hypothetical protein AO366_1400 [Moraxella catarrhalis]|nr:hypothetical protein E9U_06492 [Moraxella catarrhalis BC8]EGE27168.1 hypothetical protein E9Y_00203 [Moraxella catarrhalis 101P30B1]OAV32990.1 hypothetical protein AO366_1400 [Moraxella catarrhalis]